MIDHGQGGVLLGVNIDHVASMRQARGTRYPDPVQAALMAEQAGADGITVHLREDRRHIQDRDVRLLAEVLTTRMNLEMAMTAEMIAIAEVAKPAHCCLVPERRAELTTEGGLDVAGQPERTAEVCARLGAAGVAVSLFIDPTFTQLDAAAAAGAPAVEIHTGEYANAADTASQRQALARVAEAVAYGHALGLTVNAGHGLHYHNVRAIAALPGLNELNIGHSIIARALFTGLEPAVVEMKRLIDGAISR